MRERAIPFRVAGGRPKNITPASEKALAKDWLLPEEDVAWADFIRKLERNGWRFEREGGSHTVYSNNLA